MLKPLDYAHLADVFAAGLPNAAVFCEERILADAILRPGCSNIRLALVRWVWMRGPARAHARAVSALLLRLWWCGALHLTTTLHVFATFQGVQRFRVIGHKIRAKDHHDD